MVKTQWEKMSKSRGNAVGVDELVHGVHSVQSGFEFRDSMERTIDLKTSVVFRGEGGDYFQRCGHEIMPAFLCRCRFPLPAMFARDGEEPRRQHANLHGYWNMKRLALCPH